MYVARTFLTLVVVGCGTGVGPGGSASGGGPTNGVSGWVGANGSTVGGYCRSDRDCASRCVINGDFPGMCTVSCRSDQDCPAGTSCVDEAGGICAINCRDSNDCRQLGYPYVCDSKGRQGASGDVWVCRKS